MTDPRRLLDEGDLSEVEHRALAAALAAAPPPELVAGVWTELTVALGAAGAVAGVAGSAGHAAAPGSVAPGASSATTALATGGKIAILKALAVGAAVGAVTSGGTALLTAPSRSPHGTMDSARVAAPARRSPPVRAGEGPRGEPRPLEPSATDTTQKVDQPARSARHSGAVPFASAAPEATSALAPRENPSSVAGFGRTDRAKQEANAGARSATEAARTEARLVGVAREALRRHEAANALGVLADVERRFPNGILLQEREALTISALAATGRRDEASARARAFLRAFPNSPHAERVQRAIDER